MMVLWPWQLAPPSNLDHARRGRSPPLVPMLSRGHFGKERNRAKWPDSLPARLEHPLCSLSLSLSFFASRRTTPRSSTTTLPKKEARTSATSETQETNISVWVCHFGQLKRARLFSYSTLAILLSPEILSVVVRDGRDCIAHTFSLRLRNT